MGFFASVIKEAARLMLIAYKGHMHYHYQVRSTAVLNERRRCFFKGHIEIIENLDMYEIFGGNHGVFFFFIKSRQRHFRYPSLIFTLTIPVEFGMNILKYLELYEDRINGGTTPWFV